MYISKQNLLIFTAGFVSSLLLFAAKGDFTSTADTTKKLSYHGTLTDTNGVPIQGAKVITFRLYDAEQGGVPKWEETQTVMFTEGNFHVLLGAVNPLPLPLDQPCWLGVTVEGSPELSPRQPLTAAPYSLHTQSIADGAITADKIADGQVVKSIGGLTDDVILAAGSHVTVTPNGNTLTIAATTQIPKGVIVMWSGSVASIPVGWVLCDGTNGTPDLRARFIVAAGGSHGVGNTGGSDTHTHGAGNYAGPNHTHTGTTGNESNVSKDHGGAENQYDAPHFPHHHTFTTNAGGTGTITGTSGSANSLPPYYALAFIMKR